MALAHPFDDGTAALLYRSLEATGATLGEDAARYRRLMAPLVERSEPLLDDVLGPLGVPSSLAAFAGFSVRSALPASALARRGVSRAAGPGAVRGARGALDGAARRGCPPRPSGSCSGVLAHVAGWPLPVAGSQRLADALVSYLRSLGGEVVTGRRVEHSLSRGRGRCCSTSRPRQLLAMAPDLPARYRRRLERFRYGPGVFKLDWALDGPIPWRAPECAHAATVHLGGTLEEIVASEREPWRGGIAERPFVLLAQQSLFDPSRAPEGKHTAWAYCHVPNGSTVDMTERIEAQVERFAPGFRDLDPGALGDGAGGDGGAQPRTTSAATSTAAPPTCAVRPAVARDALLDAASGRVPLLGLDAAGRGRARDVRLPRGHGPRFSAKPERLRRPPS